MLHIIAISISYYYYVLETNGYFKCPVLFSCLNKNSNHKDTEMENLATWRHGVICVYRMGARASPWCRRSLFIS